MEGLERSGSAGMEPLQLRSPPRGSCCFCFLGFVDRPWRRIVEVLMLAPVIIEFHPVVDVGPEFAYRVVAPEPDLLILQAPPETLDKHVVHPTPLAIHTDLNVVFLERRDPVPACELAS